MNLRDARRRILGASIGNFAESYDFFIYGVSTPVLAAHFFPKSHPVAALLGTFAVYAVAFLVRPLGGIIFGYLGDRTGRIRVLALTVVLMGGSTMVIGFLPTYAQLGFVAPVLLVLCRVAQGLSQGGEVSGSQSYVVESAPDDRRGLWVNITTGFSILPAAVPGFVVLALHLGLGDTAYNDWAWRIPFLLGGVIAGVGLWLRLRLDDPDEYVEAARETSVRNPIRYLFKMHLKPLIVVSLLVSVNASMGSLLLGYMYTFVVKEGGLGSTAALLSNSVAIIAAALLLPTFGLLVDRVGRRPVLMGACVWIMSTLYLAFSLASSGTVAGAYIGQLLLAIGFAAVAAAAYTAMLELFPTAVRYTGHAIAYNFGTAVFGGTVPLVAAALVVGTGSPLAPAFYVSALALMGLIVAFVMPETKGIRLRTAISDRDATLALEEVDGPLGAHHYQPSELFVEDQSGVDGLSEEAGQKATAGVGRGPQPATSGLGVGV